MDARRGFHTGVRCAFLDALLMPEYAPFFIGGIGGIYLVHRDRRDALAWGIVVVSWLLGQHHAVADLWHPANADAFSYRSSTVITLIVTAGFAAVALIALSALHRIDWPWLRSRER